jgi:biotin transport system substrate-specific component
MFALSPATLAGQITPAARIPEALRFALLAVLGSVFVAVSAQLTVPLWPVPITGQTLAVLVIGMAYGAPLGAVTLTLYMVEGIAGLPVFAKLSAGPHVLAGPTGGYIVGFIAAATFVGWLAERGWSRSFILTALAQFLGSGVIFAFGVPWLTLFYAGPGAAYIAKAGAETAFGAALATGFYPFLLEDVVKVVLAACLMPAAWRLVGLVRR